MAAPFDEIERSGSQHAAVAFAGEPTPGQITPRSRSIPRSRLIAIAGLFVGYALLSQYGASSTNPHAKSIGAALSIAPLILIAIVLIWRSIGRLPALVFACASSALFYWAWPGIVRNYGWADLCQQCGMYGLVAVILVRSLSAGRVPICAQLTNRSHGTLTPLELAYARGATVAWGLFYVFLTLAILALFFLLTQERWYFFVNFVPIALMVLGGIIDRVVRRRILPGLEPGAPSTGRAARGSDRS